MTNPLHIESPAMPTLAVALGAAVWGIYWWPLRYAEGLGMAGLWPVVLASAVPLVIVMPLLLYYRRQASGSLGTVIIIGLLSGGAISFYSIGLMHTTVVRATLLFYLTPVWSTIIGISLLNEAVKWNRWAAIGLGLLGLYFIVGGNANNSQAVNIGDWFAIASGLCWGIAGVLIKKNPRIGVTVMVGWQHLFAFLVALTACLAFSGFEQLPEIDMWLEAMPVMIGYSWFGLVPSLFAIFWASARLFPGRVGILMMTEVLVAVISASLFLEESVTAIEWFGVVLIVAAGVFEVTGSDKEAPVKPQAES